MDNLNKMKKLLKQIDENKSYFNIHAGDVLGGAFLIIIAMLSFSYIALKKNNVKIRKEWAIHKCKPNISPLAGFINAPPGSTFSEQLEYTKKNYVACNETILKSNIDGFILPFENMKSIIEVVYEMAQQAIDKIYILYYVLQGQFAHIIALIFSKIFQLFIEVQMIMFKAKDTLMKTAGILQALFLYIVGSAFFLMTFLNSLFEIAEGILKFITYVIAAIMIVALAFFFLPGFQIAAMTLVKVGLSLLVTYLGMAIPLMICMVVLAMITAEIERRENLVCFHPETKIKLANGKYKAMKDLDLGEKITKNIEVVAVLRIKGEEKDKYYKIYSKELNDYIYVTGTHLIMHPTTKKFIPVEEYEKATITNSWTNEMSCLVTSNNRIPIGEYTFWDWED